MKINKNIVFGLTGSIACYKACNLISMLIKSGAKVKPVVTKSALEFVSESTLEGLTHMPVYSDMFERTRALDHIDLTKWADLAIICPATANIINKMSAGIADDPITTLFLAFDREKPFMVAPAMNKAMFAHPATVKSMNTLREWGVNILEAGTGYQACGDIGKGRLMEPENIFNEISKEFL